MHDRQARVNLRVPSSLTTAVIGWILLLLLSSDSILLGRWDVLAKYGPGLCLIGWFLFLFFWAPGISVGTSDLTVRNVWVSTRIPYHRVTDITIRALVRVKFFDNDGKERVIASWNAPGIPKLPKTFSRRSTTESLDLHGPSRVLLDRWEQYSADSGQTVTQRPHWLAITITVALVIFALIRLSF